ncbi:MAG: hypothetical protein IPP46_18340 [Bacteroidetes bacterium]|nr:hypothetical protein [Bacteroidota bacterium]
MKPVIRIFLLVLLMKGSAFAATEKIIIDEVNGNTNYPRPQGAFDVEYAATNGNWNANNFNENIPVNGATNYKIIVIGDWLDTWDRMVVTKSDGVTAAPNFTISGQVKSVVNNKGRTTFILTVGTAATPGEIGMIRFRYNVETNLGDLMPGENIKFRVCRKPIITNISIDPYPTFEVRTLFLKKGQLYNLTFTLLAASGNDIRYTGNGLLKDLNNGLLSNSISILNKPEFRSPFISATSATTFKMQVITSSNNVNAEINFQDKNNLLYQFVDSIVDRRFRQVNFSYHVAASFGAFNNTPPNSSMTSVFPGEKLPDIVPPKSELNFGTTYSFGNQTVTDQQGKIYKNIIAKEDAPNDLGFLLKNGNITVANGGLVLKPLGSDPLLGNVFLGEVLLAPYTFPIKNTGIADAKVAFFNEVVGFAEADPIKLPDVANLARRTAATFPKPKTVTIELPSLAAGISNNCVVHKSSVQIFMFSNKPGLFFCDNAWPVDPSITIFVDKTNTILELNDGESKNKTTLNPPK